MICIMEAARYVVHLSYNSECHSLTPLKLQKLLYLAQGWSYVWDNVPLFNDNFQAWQYGPVNIEVYNHFKKYGRQEIPQEEEICFLEDNDACETLEGVWDEFGNKSAFDLVEITHQQMPWRDAYEKNSVITNQSIKDFFQATY